MEILWRQCWLLSGILRWTWLEVIEILWELMDILIRMNENLNCHEWKSLLESLWILFNIYGNLVERMLMVIRHLGCTWLALWVPTTIIPTILTPHLLMPASLLTAHHLNTYIIYTSVYITLKQKYKHTQIVLLAAFNMMKATLGDHKETHNSQICEFSLYICPPSRQFQTISVRFKH